MRFRDLPGPSQIIVVCTLAIAVAAAIVAQPYWTSVPAWQIMLGCVACCGLSYVQIDLTQEKGRMSLGFAGLLAVVLVWGPAGGAIVGFIEGAASNLLPHLPLLRGRQDVGKISLVKLLFNAANHSMSASLAGLVYVRLAGPEYVHLNPDLGMLPWLRHAAVSGMAATTMFFLVNTWNTAAILASSKRLNVVKVWHENFFWTAPQYLMSGSCVIGGVVLLNIEAWRWATVFVLPPIWVVYYSYRLYMDKIRNDLKHISQLNELNNSMIASLATAIDAKDHYTNKHLSRVQCYALEMSSYLKLPFDVHEAIRCAALVHDIGKLGVPENILKKPTKLTAEEHLRVQQHVEIGAAILRPVQFPWPVVDVVMGHHERWDGLGYPQGLKGDEIPIGARVIAVADVFDALTSDRPYRQAMTFPEALDLIRADAGTHFDPNVVDVLMAVMEICETKIAAMSDGDPEQIQGMLSVDGINDEVMEQISRANSEFLAMYDVAQSLPVPVNLHGTVDAVLDKIQHMVPCTTCVVFLKDEIHDELRAESVSGRYAHLLQGMTMKVGEGLSGRAFQDLKPIVNGMATLDVGRKIPPEESVELNASLIVPIRANGETLGTLSVYHSSYNIFTDDHRRLLTLIADHTANSIYSARRLHQTEEMAFKDPLTGLPNARALSEWLTRRLESSFLTHEAFAVLLVDLDNFKQVNDTLGHLQGDEFLRQSGHAMQLCVRSEDLLARYAGDEFVLAVQMSDFEGVTQLCRRLSASVAELHFADGLQLGASVGFAIYPEDGLNASELIKVADSRMYQDKNRRKQRR